MIIVMTRRLARQPAAAQPATTWSSQEALKTRDQETERPVVHA